MASRGAEGAAGSVAYVMVNAGELEAAREAPRPVPRSRRRATLNELFAGVCCLLLGLWAAGLCVSRFRLVFAASAFVFLGFGVWVTSGAMRRRAVLQSGRLLPARVFLMDVAPQPIELRFVQAKEEIPSGGSLLWLERRTSAGIARAEYEVEGGPRNAFTRLSPGELPIPVRFSDGRVSPAVCVHRGRAELWAAAPGVPSASA